MLIHRVTPGQEFSIDLYQQPFPYVRLLIGSRWTAKPGSSAQKYMTWVEDVRDSFDQLGYQQPKFGFPFQEPLHLSGAFHVTENWEGKDLDNLIKGILDTMNPSHRKDWSKLRTFAWVDDRQVRSYGTWVTEPAEFPRIRLTIKPLWGRIDPSYQFIDGFSELRGSHTYFGTDDGMFWVKTTGAHEAHFWTKTKEAGGQNRYWIWPRSDRGQFLIFPHLEQLMLYQAAHQTKNCNPDIFLRVLENNWDKVTEGLITGNAELWTNPNVTLSQARKVLGLLRGVMPAPREFLTRWQAVYDPDVFEALAARLSQERHLPWGQVRRWLQDRCIDYTQGVDILVDTLFDQLPKSPVKKITKKAARAAAKKKGL